MRESAMSPEVTIANSESETDHIEVRNDGTHDASQPNTLGDFGSIETRSNTEGCDRVRECRRHYFFREYPALHYAIGRGVSISTPDSRIATARVLRVGFAGFSRDSSKGLLLVPLQAVEQKAAVFAVFGGQPGKASESRGLVRRDGVRDNSLW
jgi:hypothetical protein